MMNGFFTHYLQPSTHIITRAVTQSITPTAPPTRLHSNLTSKKYWTVQVAARLHGPQYRVILDEMITIHRMWISTLNQKLVF